MGRREWLLKRNCSLTPRQTVAAWAVLVTLSLAIGLACAWQGAPYVLVFSGLEMTAVTAAFVIYSRHATDCDRLVLEQGRLTVEQVRGGRSRQYLLPVTWLRVTAPTRRRDPIRLVAGEVKVDVGLYLLEGERRALARELRQALAE
ncbi:DUF2244 domain-containing protein [Pseudoduganella armeniaca]|uniref:DUF2244 domain-containing protein n=1 Tax=Pseudoduganella armeniaca TaxID=2072590 RepID=A0A2R4C3V2_9BURK|nr:DUF2244 domain-containing protein [Pseudoduganella armeniaca]AVR94285.1 DUF2244 domain-containing protein [Pseudoduganella armeniaca]